ncbi:hypothetical protein A4X06_0g7407, partial [Tilletia controversa]
PESAGVGAPEYGALRGPPRPSLACDVHARPRTPTATTQAAFSRTALGHAQDTQPVHPSQQGHHHPGASSSRTLVGNSSTLLDRLSKTPAVVQDRKGKGRQAPISDYPVPMGTKKTVPTTTTLAPSKRPAPSTGTSARTAHINSRPCPYAAK